MLYLIYYYRQEDGSLQGIFPDLVGVTFSGEGFVSLHKAAEAAGKQYLEETYPEKASRPEPSFIYDICDNFTGGHWSAVYIME